MPSSLTVSTLALRSVKLTAGQKSLVDEAVNNATHRSPVVGDDRGEGGLIYAGIVPHSDQGRVLERGKVDLRPLHFRVEQARRYLVDTAGKVAR